MVVDLSKRPYWVAYECCDVLGEGLETTMCWFCGEHGGRSLFDIPDHHPELKETMHQPWKPGNGASMQFSQTPEGDIGWRP